MEQGAKTAQILSDLQIELKLLSNGMATVQVRDDLDENINGDPAATVVLRLKQGEEFAMYSTASVAGLQSYLRGFSHAVKSIAGTYAFKSINEEAKKHRKESILPVVRAGRAAQFRAIVSSIGAPVEYGRGLGECIAAEIKALERRDAATSPRFALWRCKYKPVEDAG